MSKKLAIVLPGGGSRGIIQAKLIDELDKRVGNYLQNHYDKYEYGGISKYISYIAGTSIGSMNAMNTLFYSPQENINMYLDNAGNVLPKSSFFPITDPYFSNSGVQKITNDRCDKKTFGDVSTKILINSFNLDTCKETIFTNIGTEEDRQKLHDYVWNIKDITFQNAILSSIALPALLPSHTFEYQRDSSGVKKYTEIDGGMVNNSPVMKLISNINALDKIPLSDLCVVSIDAGNLKGNLSHMSNSGLFKYIKNSDLVLAYHMCAAQSSEELHAEALLQSNGGSFFNIKPDILEKDYLDAINDSHEQLSKYLSIAEDFILTNNVILDNAAKTIAEECIIGV